MRTNATSGLTLSFCVSICVLMVVLSVSDRAYAKRGCATFGHSCFGGHGKRFDPLLRNDILQDNDITTRDRNQEYQPSRLSNKLLFIGSEQKLRGQEETPFPESRRQVSQRYDPYTLSLLVGQWVFIFSLVRDQFYEK